MTATAAMARERPVLFSGEMVPAILDGRKTQTRRVIREAFPSKKNAESFAKAIRCPYGAPGDQLWVREGVADNYGNGTSLVYRADCVRDDSGWWWERRGSEEYLLPSPVVWRSPIHLRRHESRLTLQITDVRVQRLQDIGYADAKAEGAPRFLFPADELTEFQGAMQWYCHLWDSLNAKRGYSWDRNPWVWCLSFHPHPELGRGR